eukprot:jgi/Ulvmu1/10825/UM069_0062.1
MDDGNSPDLATFVQNLLEQMQARFQGMSENILARIDEMGGRLDELEKSISDLVQQAGVESSPSGTPEKA